MKDLSHLVESIRQKSENLIKKNAELLVINDKQQNEIVELNEKLENAQKQISDLEEKNRILKIAGSVSEGNKNAKQKINELVREIDKCIAQLNT